MLGGRQGQEFALMSCEQAYQVVYGAPSVNPPFRHEMKILNRRNSFRNEMKIRNLFRNEMKRRNSFRNEMKIRNSFRNEMKISSRRNKFRQFTIPFRPGKLCPSSNRGASVHRHYSVDNDCAFMQGRALGHQDKELGD